MKTAREMVEYLYKFYTLQEIADMSSLSTATIYNAKTGYQISGYSIDRICSAYVNEIGKRSISPKIVEPDIFSQKITKYQNQLISERLTKETEAVRSPDSAYLEKIRLALTDQFQALNGNTDFKDDTRQ